MNAHAMAQERHAPPLATERVYRARVGICLAFAPAMRKSNGFFEPDDAGGRRALITLQRGVSSEGTWTFDACDAGVTITVGGSASCDWQIASPGVTPLFLAFTGEALLVRSIKHDDRVRLNGHTMAETWVPLSHGDVLDLGPSTLAVSLAPSIRPKSDWRERRKQKKAGTRRAQARRATAAEQREEQDRAQREAREQRASARAAALVLREDHSRNAPALFQEHEQHGRDHGTLMWYAAIGFATLMAYAGWVFLLDEL